VIVVIYAQSTCFLCRPHYAGGLIVEVERPRGCHSKGVIEKMDVRFVAGVAPIVNDAGEARRFYGEKLSLPLKMDGESDYTEVTLPGLKHFGLWTLRDAAQSTFGRDEWPDYIARPQATIELEVDDVAAAVSELKSRGLELIQDTKVEPWGQTTARLLSPEGLLIGVTYTPWLREEATS
jgi:catechol 2,3-dioxygenase-like lactoylglutathione lyase family enzyme